MQARASVEKKASKPRPRSTKSKETETEKEKERPAAPRSKEKDMAKEKEKEKEKEKAAPPPHVATPARLLLRVHSAKKLHVGAFAQGVYCKMYVGETAMLHGSQKSLFSKMTGSGHAEDTTAEAALVTPHHREFRTRTVAPPADGAEGVALWDENFDVLLTDASRDILSIRVKCKHRLYPAVLGVCAISLKQLRIGHSVDTWVPLLKGTREVASLKLQIVLSPVTDPLKNAERLAKPDLQADIKTALAANQSADDAIERLLASATLKLSNRGGTAIPTDNNDKHDDHNKSPNESSSPRLSDGDKNHRHKNNENTSHPEMAVPKARAPVAATPTFSA